MLKLTDKYYLDSDSLNYILQERRVVSDVKSKNYGKETFTNVAYFGSLDMLFNYIIEKEIKIKLETLNNITEIIKLKKEITNNYEKSSKL